MTVLVCEAVRARTIGDLVRARDAASTADLVELRLDDLAAPDVSAALAGRALPVVVTCRPRWEGGGFDGDEATRARLLEDALRLGAEFVDVEWAAPWREAFVARWADRVVLSWHDFAGTPPDLLDRARAMAGAGAAVTKIAVTTQRLRDLGPLLGLKRLLGDTRFVAIGMGLAGIASRVLPHRFGSCWTYAGQGVAPGQVPTERLVGEFRVRQATAATAVFGLVGRPIAHSLSPAMHNAAFGALGMDAVYLPFEAADFQDFEWAADTFDVAGASVTAPFKEAAGAAAQRLDARATSVGVVNTLRREADGTWSGRNTDVDGFLAPLADVALRGLRVGVLGAGGAARAAVAGLVLKGAQVTVYARRLDSARDLADRFGVAAGAWPPVAGTWDILVNTTPVGTWPEVDALPVEASIVHGQIVYDLVYNPARTAFLRAAAAQGSRTIGGLEMLVAQAIRQFEWWTGQVPPPGVMEAAARRRLEEFRDEPVRTLAER